MSVANQKKRKNPKFWNLLELKGIALPLKKQQKCGQNYIINAPAKKQNESFRHT